ncbi:MAG: small ribosomal subunit Rsm22 family protein [Ruminiclostridium sp.]|nr:small ribosomal subunit Rsm22 family protein [Ruminiclostridium sp.]
MNLPIELQIALTKQLISSSQSQILEAAENISLRYRTRSTSKQYIRNQNEALAYAIARMPATFGAVYKALSYSLECMNVPQTSPVSLLDIGAGTGAASWAASELLFLDSVVCIEYLDVMRKLGEAMMHHSEGQLKNTNWKSLDIISDTIDNQAEYVIASYVLNELEVESQLIVAEKLWRATKKLLLFVEPGTPEGYMVIKRIRQRFLEMGVHVLAPCTHENHCPLSEKDWCHFTCRIQRNRLHKLAKGGDLPYEDEKFSYLALFKENIVTNGARILRHPYIGKGHVKLELCTKTGLVQKTFTKRDDDQYKIAKKADCGDLIMET